MGAALACVTTSIAECACCAALSCCGSLANYGLRSATRFGHFLVLLVTFVIAIILGIHYPKSVTGLADVDIHDECEGDFEEICTYRQLIYRASFACFILFTILAGVTACSDYVNKGLWPVKFAVAFLLFFAFWWGGNDTFSNFAELARVVSFFWLLVQGLLLIDFACDIHDVIMAKADEADSGGGGSRFWYVLYLVLCGSFAAAALTGIGFLYSSYADCSLGAFFVSVTLIMGTLTTITSLLNSVNKGLLTPCVMFAYSTFMCWYALLSSSDEGCNPTAENNGGLLKTALGIVTTVSLVILLYIVYNGTKILNIFNPEGEGLLISHAPNPELRAVINGDSPTKDASVTTTQPTTSGAQAGAAGGVDEQPSGTPHERVFFHVLMVLVSCYAAMLCTSWGSTDGYPVSESSRQGNESMWLKILSQWVILILYCRILHVAYMDDTA